MSSPRWNSEVDSRQVAKAQRQTRPRRPRRGNSFPALFSKNSSQCYLPTSSRAAKIFAERGSVVPSCIRRGILSLRHRNVLKTDKGMGTQEGNGTDRSEDVLLPHSHAPIPLSLSAARFGCGFSALRLCALAARPSGSLRRSGSVFLRRRRGVASAALLRLPARFVTGASERQNVR